MILWGSFHPFFNASAYDLNEHWSVGGIISGAYQYLHIRNPSESDDKARGALVCQPEIRFTPTEKDTLFVKLGFAAGNGLNNVSPFVLAPWAADLENDVKDINGRNRDYLLTAWYKHLFKFSEYNQLGITGGIIDATDYIDDNAYSNDEYVQFMNQALVNAPNGFAPSYDYGGAVEWDISDFSLRGVVMDVGENNDGNAYYFFGFQAGYRLTSPLGTGHYRVIFQRTNQEFLNTAGTRKYPRECLLLSFDQQLGEILGAWLRCGWQDKRAHVNYDALYSGGIDISGKLWGRNGDNIGIGCAHIRGTQESILYTNVVEIYGRFAINDIFSITGDIQYMKDAKNSDSPEGFIYGLRATAEF